MSRRPVWAPCCLRRSCARCRSCGGWAAFYCATADGSRGGFGVVLCDAPVPPHPFASQRVVCLRAFGGSARPSPRRLRGEGEADELALVLHRLARLCARHEPLLS
ncbi:hypothetical protein ABB37_01859 [Leptomonas pyrrhocoris]|uniref:Uncharacterized protein n=1 Tax=Leptomonas pyrrhocoris TaxID=157538 RepID=A0A0M9G6P4_LEPPY|nr:hypothetical protein ABB37_01859 [Leptomonas pyrrhocoris]KPA83557.1 hypothetical protein ABB37_01859 [Leptomonas pyrrhocoris]|eukprot:XP_015661996.1 hypothetical protein ABB37_01859 [Leptomonas pyrrhocoris]